MFGFLKSGRTWAVVIPLLLVTGCDTFVGPGFLIGRVNDVQKAITLATLRKGLSRQEVYCIASLIGSGFYDVGESARFPQTRGLGQPAVYVDFFHYSSFCASSFAVLTVKFDQSDRVRGWNTDEEGSFC